MVGIIIVVFNDFLIIAVFLLRFPWEWFCFYCCRITYVW